MTITPGLFRVMAENEILKYQRYVPPPRDSPYPGLLSDEADPKTLLGTSTRLTTIPLIELKPTGTRYYDGNELCHYLIVGIEYPIRLGRVSWGGTIAAYGATLDDAIRRSADFPRGVLLYIGGLDGRRFATGIFDLQKGTVIRAKGSNGHEHMFEGGIGIRACDAREGVQKFISEVFRVRGNLPLEEVASR